METTIISKALIMKTTIISKTLNMKTTIISKTLNTKFTITIFPTHVCLFGPVVHLDGNQDSAYNF